MGRGWEGDMGEGAVDQDRGAERTEGGCTAGGSTPPWEHRDMNTLSSSSSSPGNVGAEASAQWLSQT